jgi:glycosyltransferase involved in cell wall biosynthesis
MSESSKRLISVVVPVFDEQAGIAGFHASLTEVLDKLSGLKAEIIYCDDGSTDGTLEKLHELSKKDDRVRLVRLSRNFGKELATTAGINEARGAAVVTIDADGQHPVELLPEFVKKWQDGSRVVLGLRTDSRQAGFTKRIGSKLFYRLFSRFTKVRLVPGATDYRLIDKVVRDDFVRLTEHNRITRGLIDWLGYERSFVSYAEKPRLHDSASYSFRKLGKLAIDSVISLSSSPLYITAWIGAIVLPLSALLGLVMIIDKLLSDPLHWHATGGAYVSVLVLFLIGILLMSQGIIGLYLSHIHSETQNRPLYVIDREASVRL